MANAIFAALSLKIINKQEFRIIPAGCFKAVDGRPVGGAWMMTAAIGAKLVAAAQSRQIDYVIDYEHQTQLAETNGKPAPAAGWFKKLDWRDDGLYVTDARWTAAAKAMLDAGSYRFVSPTFLFDKETFEVIGLLNIALTNSPALHDLTDLASLAMANPMLQGGAASDLTEKDRDILKRCFGMDSAALATANATQANVGQTAMTERELQSMANFFQMVSGITSL